MTNSVKLEAKRDRGGKRGGIDEWVKPKIVKKERQSKSGIDSVRSQEPPIQEEEQGIDERRAIRSQYHSLVRKINDADVNSDKFKSIIKEVDSLHEKKPREQIADAEALLKLVQSLLALLKSKSAHGGVSPAEFVNALISGFGQTSLEIDPAEITHVLMKWKDIEFVVCSPVLVSCGCTTMMGPMNTELKQRKKAVGSRKRTKSGLGVKPKEVDDTEDEKQTDTDKNMAVMFNILRKTKRVKIESLVLNRRSFSQTVENLFALSFLVKDGRVEIIVDKSGSYFVLPRNAPAADLVMLRDVIYHHFVFRFDYEDWKLMSTMVVVGEELMPHRKTEIASSACGLASEQASQTTPIKKQGLVIQEETVFGDSSDIEGDNEDSKNGGTLRKCKLRRLTCEVGS